MKPRDSRWLLLLIVLLLVLVGAPVLVTFQQEGPGPPEPSPERWWSVVVDGAASYPALTPGK
jgi:hypothetical protein